MRTEPAWLLACCLAAMPVAAHAQSPLSAIDWLSNSVVVPAPVALPRPPRDETDIATSALPEEVTVTPLGAPSPDTVGLAPAHRLGLPADLWGTSSSGVLAQRLSSLKVPAVPALRDLFKAMLTAELDPPPDSMGERTLFLARVDALLRLGALDDAGRLLDRAGRTEPEYFRRWFDISLLNGTEDIACDRMRRLPQITPTYAARIYCLARGGDWHAAAVTLETAARLGLVEGEENELLGRFLLAELSDGGPLLPPQRHPSPLIFAMYAAVGEPIGTTNLPVAFAHADLRPITGWKARISAAERLARIGAIDGKRLIEVYSERLPAASGGVWDRVEAVQAFATALERADPTAVGNTLPAAYAAVEDAELETALADATVTRLTPLPLSGSSAQIRLKLMLLAGAEIADTQPDPSPQEMFWLALARGDTAAADPYDALSTALLDGFLAEGAPIRLQTLLEQNRKGEAVLRAIDLFGLGANGNLDELQDAVALLRAVGLDAVARRAALHLLILDRSA